jgi:hypothetical protein
LVREGDGEERGFTEATEASSSKTEVEEGDGWKILDDVPLAVGTSHYLLSPEIKTAACPAVIFIAGGAGSNRDNISKELISRRGLSSPP